MGLDTTHDCWHGAYSSFMKFRRVIAKAVGITLDHMEGFASDSAIGHIRWETLTPDPIHTLLNHSDCDGYIEVADLIPLAERLEQIGPTLPDCPDWPDYYRDRAATFAKGLRQAWDAKERVEFH